MASLPTTCSSRLRHWEVSVYAPATRVGSQVFHASSAACTFWRAVSSVNGGSGGRGSIGCSWGRMRLRTLSTRGGRSRSIGSSARPHPLSEPATDPVGVVVVGRTEALVEELFFRADRTPQKELHCNRQQHEPPERRCQEHHTEVEREEADVQGVAGQ